MPINQAAADFLKSIRGIPSHHVAQAVGTLTDGDWRGCSKALMAERLFDQGVSKVRTDDVVVRATARMQGVEDWRRLLAPRTPPVEDSTLSYANSTTHRSLQGVNSSFLDIWARRERRDRIDKRLVALEAKSPSERTRNAIGKLKMEREQVMKDIARLSHRATGMANATARRLG